MIHALGPRNEAPFIPVNCGAIPGELMESEFFGHKKGSFTGAVSDKTGLFQAADSGTLFLDEVADLPLHMQVKLLRAIQEKSIRPIGDQKERSVDIRILSATHKDLQQLVEAGHFRQDLFYRINVIQLDVPPLRAREGDIHLLAHHVLKRLATEWGIEDPILAPSAQDALARYSFPGNVRELENILERALTLSDQQTILEEHLQLPTQTQVNLPTETAPKEAALNNPNNSNLNKTATEHSESASALTSTSIVLEEELENINDLEAYLARIEKQVILLTLKTTRWNRTAAAKKLGMTFRSLRYRLKKLDIDEHSDTSDT